MNKIGIAAVIGCCLLASPGSAQFRSLMNRVKAKVDQKIDQKVDQKIDQAMDPKGHQKDNAPGSAGTDAVSKSQPDGIRAFSKYDFVPGERILYAEDFLQDAIGELPTGWNSSGSGEVVKLDKVSGQWLRLHQPVAYLTANQRSFGQNYTIEFDLILQLKNNGWLYPEFIFSAIASRDREPGSNDLLKNYESYSAVTATLHPGENNSSRAHLESRFEKKQYFKGDPTSIGELQNWYGQPVHVAVQVQKERYRCWVNEIKVFDIPKAVPVTDSMTQLRFEVGHTNYPENAYGVFISNIRIATGLPDTRHKLIDDGRFSTNGILFDPQSAIIRPESFGVIREIAAALKENPDVRIRITGHTSSDGDDAMNMELSRKRAAAVKDLLGSEWQIDGSRIETEGKGETVPVADNKTKEGRAQNRRVEFIKL